MYWLKRIAKYLGYLLIVIIAVAVILITLINVAPDFIFSLLSRSHTSANIPDKSDFDVYLQRDIDNYFSTRLGKSVTVGYEFLRNGPTQSGVAYPKYYLWIEVSGEESDLTKGAIRVAAISKTSFEVTDFVSVDRVRENPEMLEDIFPSEVAQKILERAN